MFVCCECCVLSGRGLCDELITRPEESYRLWCVVVSDLENLKNEETMTRVRLQRHRKIKIIWIWAGADYEQQRSDFGRNRSERIRNKNIFSFTTRMPCMQFGHVR